MLEYIEISKVSKVLLHLFRGVDWFSRSAYFVSGCHCIFWHLWK